MRAFAGHAARTQPRSSGSMTVWPQALYDFHERGAGHPLNDVSHLVQAIRPCPERTRAAMAMNIFVMEAM